MTDATDGAALRGVVALTSLAAGLLADLPSTVSDPMESDPIEPDELLEAVSPSV
ncbi:hypothetical protein [Mycolicibacterium phlei]|jgi:hypothetical protein